MTPQNCWDELRPLCNDLRRMVSEAPLDAEERASLATLLAVHFMGAAIVDQRRARGDNTHISVAARHLMEMIVEDLERGEKPTLVPARPEEPSP